MIASFIWYLGLALTFLGALTILRPIRRLGVPTRRRAAGLALAGLVLAVASAASGGSLQRIKDPASLLDRYFPVYQFNESHAVAVRASPARTYQAVFAVTPDEITFFRTLTWLRRFGRSGPPDILNAPSSRPLLETALATSFRKVAEQPNEEIVLGTFVVAPPGAGARKWTPDTFAALDEPGFVKAAMNFRLTRTDTGTMLHTETRVYATDRKTERLFTLYWRTIYPGSALIRRGWLDAIKARAEREPGVSARLMLIQ